MKNQLLLLGLQGPTNFKILYNIDDTNSLKTALHYVLYRVCKRHTLTQLYVTLLAAQSDQCNCKGIQSRLSTFLVAVADFWLMKSKDYLSLCVHTVIAEQTMTANIKALIQGNLAPLQSASHYQYRRSAEEIQANLCSQRYETHFRCSISNHPSFRERIP